VARGKTVLTVAVFAAFCLALAYWWSIRTGMPLTGQKPWWYGKDAYVRTQVIEEGRTVPTVSMRIPKGLMDTMVALGTDAQVHVEGDGASVGILDTKITRSIHLRDVWKDIQRLPEGEKLKFEEEGATVYVWIEVGPQTDATLPEPAPPDSAAATTTP
jgi:hypothetical protein